VGDRFQAIWKILFGWGGEYQMPSEILMVLQLVVIPNKRSLRSESLP
jgi:hypothetical protein